jgi:succinate dehydrogenase / fumarate reductase cytochrome b subunit
MLVSILHRLTGAGAAIAGGVLLVWWLAAAAAGADAYAFFIKVATNPWMLIIWVPLSWGVIQHTLSGLRHFVMDIGAGYELRGNRMLALTNPLSSCSRSHGSPLSILLPDIVRPDGFCDTLPYCLSLPHLAY